MPPPLGWFELQPGIGWNLQEIVARCKLPVGWAAAASSVNKRRDDDGMIVMMMGWRWGRWNGRGTLGGHADLLLKTIAKRKKKSEKQSDPPSGFYGQHYFS